MYPINRRDFMKHTAGAVAAGMAASTFGRPAVAVDRPVATTLRTLGKTGIQCSLMGMGTGTRAWNGSSEQNRRGRKAFVSLIEHAYASGITYFDMADMYGAHDYMKDALKNTVKREEVMLLTKTVSREPSLIKADLERFRRELDTDYLDIVLLHCLTDPDWTNKIQHCMDALEEAKQQGLIRAHGVSCHDFGAMDRAAETPWVDVLLARINPFGLKMDARQPRPEGAPNDRLTAAEVQHVAGVLKKAHDNGKGVLGMKIVGEGDAKDRIPESLKFVMGLGCVDAMTIGLLAPEECDQNIAHFEAVAKA